MADEPLVGGLGRQSSQFLPNSWGPVSPGESALLSRPGEMGPFLRGRLRGSLLQGNPHISLRVQNTGSPFVGQEASAVTSGCPTSSSVGGVAGRRKGSSLKLLVKERQ